MAFLLLFPVAVAGPLVLGRPTADTVLDLRLQQGMVTNDLGLEVWTQASQRVEVHVDRATGDVRYVATPRLVDALAQSDFGRVADADLKGQLDPAPLSWVEHADGSVRFDAADAGSAELVQQVAGALGRVSLPRPDGPVPEGGAWTTDRHLEVPLQVALDGESLTLSLALDAHAEHRFLGWTDDGLARVLTEGTLSLSGTVSHPRGPRLGAFARSAAEVWVDPATGLARWMAGRMALTAATDSDRRPDRVWLTFVAGAPGAPGVCAPGRHLAETGHCGGPHRDVASPVGRYPAVVAERDGAWLLGQGMLGDPFVEPPVPSTAAPWAWWSDDTLTPLPPPFAEPHFAAVLGDGTVVALAGPEDGPGRLRVLPPGGSSWQDRSPAPGPVRGAGIAVLDGLLEVVGPEASLSWDPKTDRWKTGPRLPETRVTPRLLRSGDRLLACGGASSLDWEARAPVPGCVERVGAKWKPAGLAWPEGWTSHAVVAGTTWVTSVEDETLTLWTLDGDAPTAVTTLSGVRYGWVDERLGRVVVFADGVEHALEADGLRPLPEAPGGSWYPRGDGWVVVGGERHGRGPDDVSDTPDRYADVVGAGAGGVVLRRGDGPAVWLAGGRLHPFVPPEPGRLVPVGDVGWWLGRRIFVFDGATFTPGPALPGPDVSRIIDGPWGPVAVSSAGLTRLDGDRWGAVPPPIPGAAIGSLTAHDGALVVVLDDGRVFRTPDGRRWEPLGRTGLLRPRLTSHAGHLLVHGRRPGTPPEVQSIWDKPPERRTAADRAVLAELDDFERLHTARWDGAAWLPVSRSVSDEDDDGQLLVVGDLLLRVGHDRSRVEVLDEDLQWRRAPPLDHAHFQPEAVPYGDGLYASSVLGGHEPWDLQGPAAEIPVLPEDPEGDATRARCLARPAGCP